MPSKCSNCNSFWLQATHTAPENTFNEIQDLYLFTFRSDYLSFGTTDGIILGNLNADCSYLSDEDFQKLSFNTDPAFSFGLKKGANSTSVYRNISCTYDNLILYKSIALEVTDIHVYNFSLALGKDSSQSLAISEHYPIEMKIKACASSVSREPFLTKNRKF
ncbi:Deoxyribonuclease-1-like 2 [Oopsacas minuta]|uniref:Deoxyribonuclease-1-like 2 n=1 Tax=Oopsacas minuta TaxID=111878 RepID=A0AAV7JFZ4_9METZ|nr:Deoxyribonuclease-1-like 2 [Oopsacas minuta]